MFSGLFQTLLVPTRTPAEQETDAAATNGSPVVEAPAPAEGGVTSPPATASQLPLDAAAGNGALTAERKTGANPVAPAATALAAILAGVGLVLAYPGHHHRSAPRKAGVPQTVTVTGPARGAIAPLASAALLTLDPAQVKAAAAIAAPAPKKATPAKPVAKPAASTGGTPAAEAPADGSGSGTGSTGGTSPPSGNSQSQTKKKSGGTSKPAALTAKWEWRSPSGDAQTLRFSLARSGSKSKVDQIKLVVMSGDSPLKITDYDASNLPGPTSGKCSVTSKRGPSDMLVCSVSLSLGTRYSVTVRTTPAPGIDTVGWLYGRIDGKIDPRIVVD